MWINVKLIQYFFLDDVMYFFVGEDCMNFIKKKIFGKMEKYQFCFGQFLNFIIIKIVGVVFIKILVIFLKMIIG